MKWRFYPLFILLVFLPGSGKISAADFQRHLGIKVGLDAAWITASGSDARIGFAGGAFAAIPLGRGFSFQPEVLYTRKGGKDNTSIPGIDLNLTASFRFEYLEAPLLITYSFRSRGKVVPRVFVGPALAFNFSGDVRLRTELGEAELKIRNMKNTDIGLVLGCGADLVRGPLPLVFDIRVTLGLTDFLEPAVPDVSETEVTFVRSDGSAPDLENGAVTFMAGVRF